MRPRPALRYTDRAHPAISCQPRCQRIVLFDHVPRGLETLVHGVQVDLSHIARLHLAGVTCRAGHRPGQCTSHTPQPPKPSSSGGPGNMQPSCTPANTSCLFPEEGAAPPSDCRGPPWPTSSWHQHAILECTQEAACSIRLLSAAASIPLRGVAGVCRYD